MQSVEQLVGYDRDRVSEWAAEIAVDPELARRLIRDQFADLAAADLQLLGAGWDNIVYLVDGDWAFRFPRRSIAVPPIEREIQVLSELTALPLPIPTPRFVGTRSARYPWPFFGARYIAGAELSDAAVDRDKREALGAPLGHFLRALHDPARLPVLTDRLPVDPNRRADMRDRVERTRERLMETARLGLWTIPPTVAAILDAARNLPPVAASVVAHGDLHVRHLLITADGCPSGVIDWGDVCRADPSIDLSLYWSLFSAAGREALRDAYGAISEEQLLRARVLSLFLNAILALYAHAEGLGALKREAVAGLERTMIA